MHQSVAKAKAFDVIFFPRLLGPDAFQCNSNNIRKIIKEKPGDWAGNRMAREVWVEMSKVLGFATDRFRSNVRVILQ